jgi:hypothetical protein
MSFEAGMIILIFDLCIAIAFIIKLEIKERREKRIEKAKMLL